MVKVMPRYPARGVCRQARHPWRCRPGPASPGTPASLPIPTPLGLLSHRLSQRACCARTGAAAEWPSALPAATTYPRIRTLSPIDWPGCAGGSPGGDVTNGRVLSAFIGGQRLRSRSWGGRRRTDAHCRLLVGRSGFAPGVPPHSLSVSGQDADLAERRTSLGESPVAKGLARGTRTPPRTRACWRARAASRTKGCRRVVHNRPPKRH